MSPFQRRIILLAEDNQDMVFLIQRAVEQADVDVLLQIVSNGQQAVSYLSGEGDYGDRNLHPLPQLVLSNIRMPYLNGIDLLAWIKKQPEFENLPVVLMSNTQSPTEYNQVLELGARSFLLKPASKEELADFVSQLLSLLPPVA